MVEDLSFLISFGYLLSFLVLTIPRITSILNKNELEWLVFNTGASINVVLIYGYFDSGGKIWLLW